MPLATWTAPVKPFLRWRHHPRLRLREPGCNGRSIMPSEAHIPVPVSPSQHAPILVSPILVSPILVSVVVPVRNEGPNIRTLVDEIHAALSGL